MKLDELTAERRNKAKGKSLVELGLKSEKDYVVILRAVLVSQGVMFNPMDYVTMSNKFAVEHAKHLVATEEEPAHVIRAFVPAKDVYGAYNPGEYFYDGRIKKGRVQQSITPEQLSEME